MIDHSSEDFSAEILHDKQTLDEPDFDLWTGESVEHVYRKEFGFDLDRCPRCLKDLERKFAGVLFSAYEEICPYVGDDLAICDDCSIAIVDEDAIEEDAFYNGHDYLLPLAIFNLTEGLPHPDRVRCFTTYEGHEPVFLLDDEGEMEGMVYKEDYLELKHSVKTIRRESEKILKAKRKREKKARKNNRRIR